MSTFQRPKRPTSKLKRARFARPLRHCLRGSWPRDAASRRVQGHRHGETIRLADIEIQFHRRQIPMQSISPCRLSAHGGNATKKNLISGSRFLSINDMLSLGNEIVECVKATRNHVLLRAPPIFLGVELVARGVQLEALSVENDGSGMRLNEYCYNAQPNVEIDYLTGDNRRIGNENPCYRRGRVGLSPEHQIHEVP